jgi:hypothetical protein
MDKQRDVRLEYLKGIISKWSNKYIHQIFYDRREGLTY